MINGKNRLYLVFFVVSLIFSSCLSLRQMLSNDIYAKNECKVNFYYTSNAGEWGDEEQFTVRILCLDGSQNTGWQNSLKESITKNEDIETIYKYFEEGKGLRDILIYCFRNHVHKDSVEVANIITSISEAHENFLECYNRYMDNLATKEKNKK